MPSPVYRWRMAPFTFSLCWNGPKLVINPTFTLCEPVTYETELFVLNRST